MSGRDEVDELDIQEIMARLPHRYPMLMVDRIVELTPGERAVGLKNVTINEPVFTGHYPERPIFPGVLMVEAMAQIGGIALMPPEGQPSEAGVPLLTGVDKGRFRKPVVPGDTLRIEVTVLRARRGLGKVAAVATVAGEPVAEAELMFVWRPM